MKSLGIGVLGLIFLHSTKSTLFIYFQNEREQILTSNVWVRMVRNFVFLHAGVYSIICTQSFKRIACLPTTHSYNSPCFPVQIPIWTASSEFVSSSIPSWQILTAHAQPFRGARDLAFCLKVPLVSLLVWASSGGSGETVRMRRLAWTFAARIGDKYQIRLTRPIWCCWFPYIIFIIWSRAWQNQQNGICVQRRLRSAWAAAHSDQYIMYIYVQDMFYWGLAV